MAAGKVLIKNTPGWRIAKKGAWEREDEAREPRPGHLSMGRKVAGQGDCANQVMGPGDKLAVHVQVHFLSLETQGNTSAQHVPGGW